MIGLIMICCALVLIPIFAVADDNCDKARDTYQEGVKIIDYVQRKAAFELAVKLCPTYAEAYNNLADACENLGEFDQAEKYYTKAITIKPDLFVPRLGLGELYLKSGRYKDSYNAFVKGLAIKPDNERVKAGLQVAAQRVEQGSKFLKCDQIKSCLEADETFRLMCMCPGDYYAFLKKRICVPNLHFFSGSIQLTSLSNRQLAEIGVALASKELRLKKWLIVGHADSLGPPEQNLELSSLRSDSVKDWLVKKYKLDEKSLTTKFAGETWPLASNDSCIGRSMNRRVEIILDE